MRITHIYRPTIRQVTETHMPGNRQHVRYEHGSHKVTETVPTITVVERQPGGRRVLWVRPVASMEPAAIGA